MRRIEAVTGPGVVDYLCTIDKIIRQLRTALKAEPEKIPERVSALQQEVAASRKQVENLLKEIAVTKSQVIDCIFPGGNMAQWASEHRLTLTTSSLLEHDIPIGTSGCQGLLATATSLGNGCKLLVSEIEGGDAKSLQEIVQNLQKDLGDPSAVVLGCRSGSKVSLVVAFSSHVVSSGLKAGVFVDKFAKICGGGGGGRPNLAQAGGRQPENLPRALEAAREDLLVALEAI